MAAELRSTTPVYWALTRSFEDGSAYKHERIDAVEARQGIAKSDAKKTLDGLIAVIMESAAKVEEVSSDGLGKFKIKDSPAREGRNPATGPTISIAGSRKLTFTPAKAVKLKLNG